MILRTWMKSHYIWVLCGVPILWESLLGSDAEQSSNYICCFAKQCYLLVLVFVKDVYISQESMESKKGMVKAWSPGYILQSRLVNMQCSFHVIQLDAALLPLISSPSCSQ